MIRRQLLAVAASLLTLATAEWHASSEAMTFTPSSPPGLGMLKFFWSMRQSEL